MPALLTDIARQLKETFEGFGVSEIQELEKFRKIYGDAESIRIGEMDYIVINQPYKSEEYSDLPEGTSPLFFNSINNDFAIIDTETSSTLIDEVYSRVTYMQRVCHIDAIPDKEEIVRSFDGLIGDNIQLSNEDVQIEDLKSEEGGEGVSNKANIFQCQIVKDTGVSASPDVYSFMLKSGEIKEIASSVMRQIKRTGEVNLLKDTDVVEGNKAAIQQAVFDKYINSDMDIQSITVKSIFEIAMTSLNIHLNIRDKFKRNGVYNTSYLASENNEFAALNANIHVCNECGHELVDVRDANNVSKLHINTDAFDPEASKDGKLVYAVGCEDCLEQCPECGGWHFNYAKFIGSRMYEKISLVKGRGFIKGLRAVEGNYCSCREGIEWVYDERSGSEDEHEIMPIKDMVFINYANEKIASYEDYEKFRERELKGGKFKNALEASNFAKRTLARFKKQLADRFDTDVRDIHITAAERCKLCSICCGEYYRGLAGVDYDYDFRCDMCEEMVAEKRKVVTRIDGVVFMRRKVGKKRIISKYIVTKFGNLKKLSSSVEGSVEESISKGADVAEEAAEAEVSAETVSVSQGQEQ